MDALKKKVIADFGQAIAPAFSSLNEIGQKLRDLKKPRGTPEGEAYHYAGNAMTVIPLYEYGDFKDLMPSLEITLMRLEAIEGKIDAELHFSKPLKSIISEIDKVLIAHPEFNH